MSAPSPAAVFVSYASQDAEVARRICDALRAAGIEVWFDQNELVGGDAWDRKIRSQIRDCTLFLPIISASTQARLEGYFRLEWKLAEDRSHLMAKGKPFLVPVVIDATNERDARVPDSFLAVQWTRLPDGETSDKFCTRLKHLLAGDEQQPCSDVGARPDRAQPDHAPPRPASSGRGPAAPFSKRRPWVVPAILGTAAVAVLALYLARPTSPAAQAGPGTPPPTSEKPITTVNDKSLVVLPFENLSPDPANAFFTDGMHREVIATLSRIADLKKVISRESAVALMSVPGSLADKAQKVGVANVITGSVRREGTRVVVALAGC